MSDRITRGQVPGFCEDVLPNAKATQQADAATQQAEAATQQAEAERQQREKLAAKLRELGINPDEI